MAITANGIIAAKDGDDFLPIENWIQFVKLARKVGCFIWGRKTYDNVITWEGNHLGDLRDVVKVIISHFPLELKEDFMLANSPEGALNILDGKGFKEVIITGGATINSEFAKRGLIDEVILDVNPVILGKGIPVFSPEDFEMGLELLKTEKVNKDIIELRYKVK